MHQATTLAAGWSQGLAPLTIPIFPVSSVSGAGLAPLHAFLAHLALPTSRSPAASACVSPSHSLPADAQADPPAALAAEGEAVMPNSTLSAAYDDPARSGPHEGTASREAPENGTAGCLSSKGCQAAMESGAGLRAAFRDPPNHRTQLVDKPSRVIFQVASPPYVIAGPLSPCKALQSRITSHVAQA